MTTKSDTAESDTTVADDAESDSQTPRSRQSDVAESDASVGYDGESDTAESDTVDTTGPQPSNCQDGILRTRLPEDWLSRWVL